MIMIKTLLNICFCCFVHRFYDILDYFKDLLATKYEGNLDEFLGEEFPKLSGGIGNDAIHPLIHIGYGYSVRSPVVVCEGLAYLHFSYFNLKRNSTSTEKLGKPFKNIEFFTTPCHHFGHKFTNPDNLIINLVPKVERCKTIRTRFN